MHLLPGLLLPSLHLLLRLGATTTTAAAVIDWIHTHLVLPLQVLLLLLLRTPTSVPPATLSANNSCTTSHDFNFF